MRLCVKHNTVYICLYHAYLFLSHAKARSVAKRFRICVPLWRRTRTVRPYLSNGFQPLSFSSKSNYWGQVNFSISNDLNYRPLINGRQRLIYTHLEQHPEVMDVWRYTLKGRVSKIAKIVEIFLRMDLILKTS